MKDSRDPHNAVRFGPKAADHPSVGRLCPACNEPFQVGDYVTIVALGPGADPEEQARAWARKPYSAIGLEVHWACATGDRGDGT